MILRLFIPLCLFFACSSEPAATPPPSKAEATATAPAFKPLPRKKKQVKLIDFKLPPTTPIAREHNKLIDHAIINQYQVTLANDGYFYEVLEEGEYDNFQPGDIVTADYEVYYLDGTLVDKSKSGKPLRFKVGYLIDAWNFGVTNAKPGGSIRILSPSYLAYGDDGLVSPSGDTIVGANRSLEFVIKNLELHEE